MKHIWMMLVTTTLPFLWLMTLLEEYHLKRRKSRRNNVLSRHAVSHHVLNKANMFLMNHGWKYRPSPLEMRRGQKTCLMLLWTTGSLNTTTVCRVGCKHIQLKKWWRPYRADYCGNNPST